MSELNKFLKQEDTFQLVQVTGVDNVLPAGCYTTKYDGRTDTATFTKFDIKADGIVDIPTKEFAFVLDQMKVFLDPKTREKFKKYDFLYKRSAMLYGRPGTGKTVIVNRIVQEAVKNNAIVLFNPDPRLTFRYYQDILKTDKDRLVLTIYEEFDGWLTKGKDVEEALLSVLDGEIQKDNVMYLATTNYIDRIPDRLKRPGRFGSLVEVQYPTAEARSKYLEAKGITGKENAEIVEKTVDFSIDEVKEVVLATKCLDHPLDEVIERLKSYKTKVDENDVKSKARTGMDDDDIDDELWELKEQLKAAKKNMSKSRINILR